MGLIEISSLPNELKYGVVNLDCLVYHIDLTFVLLHIDEENGQQDFDNTTRTVVIPAGGDTIDNTVTIPIIDDRINEATEGFLLIIRANRVNNNPSDLANLKYMDEGVTLLRITDDDSMFIHPLGLLKFIS